MYPIMWTMFRPWRSISARSLGRRRSFSPATPGARSSAFLWRPGPLSGCRLYGQGQFVNGAKNEWLSYQFCLEEARRLGDRGAVRKLEDIAPKEGKYPSHKAMMTQRDYLDALRRRGLPPPGRDGLLPVDSPAQIQRVQSWGYGPIRQRGAAPD